MMIMMDLSYEESTIHWNEIDYIPVYCNYTRLPTLGAQWTLSSMRMRNLRTILKMMEEFYKSIGLTDLIPIPSESKDTSESDSDCDLPLCDYFYPINVYEGKYMTFSNPLFDLNDDFTSSDDESLSDEDVLKDNVKIYSNSMTNSSLSALLVTPLSDFNEDECFDPRGDVDEIELLLHHNTSPPKMSVASILEGFTDEPPLEKNDDLFDLESKANDWKNILYDAPIDDLMTEDKVFDPGIPEIFFSPTYVRLPFEDRHYLSLTYVIRIFLPYFTYPAKSHFLLSSESEDTIFDLGISAFHFSSLEPVASHRSRTFICFNVYPNILNESPMEVCSSTCFVPNITMIWGELS
ncbi:hypothetical protein Tco_0909483 [Tanacetum coccineum]|uniref:Uncharacterized protein n=1 Tax=Tanacetum coccineum TaxID=301880 RepID=A0ABQ5CS96_9ASTR